MFDPANACTAGMVVGKVGTVGKLQAAGYSLLLQGSR